MQDSSNSTNDDIIHGLVFQDPQDLPGLELRPLRFVSGHFVPHAASAS